LPGCGCAVRTNPLESSKLMGGVHERFSVIDTIVVAALIIAFIDEGVRKSLPGAPVLVTGIKDILLIGGGLFLLSSKNGKMYRRMLTPFGPWVIYSVISALYVYLYDGSTLHLILTLKVYTLGIFIAIVGSYVAANEELSIKVWVVLFCGAVYAFCVGAMQEHAKDLLPGFYNRKIFIEKHSLAKGEYIESVFSSPQTFSLSMIILSYMALYKLLSERRSGYIYGGLMLLSIYGVYLSRIRVALFLDLVGMFAILILYISPYMRRRLLISISLFLIILVPCYVFVVGMNGGSLELQDMEFYRDLVDMDKLRGRVEYGLKLSSSSRDFGLSIFGYGAGTSGELRRFLNNQWRFGPGAEDSGFTQYHYQFGLLGVFLFFAPLGLSLFGVSSQNKRNAINYTLIGAVIIMCWVLYVWLVFKANSIVVNGFSSMILYLSFGYAIGAVYRKRQEAKSKYV